MIKLHKNLLYQTIQKSSLDVSRFELIPNPEQIYSLTEGEILYLTDHTVIGYTGIHLLNSPMWFIVAETWNLYYDVQYVGTSSELFKLDHKVDLTGFNDWRGSETIAKPHCDLTIDQIAETLAEWISTEVEIYLEELAAPDLWEQAVTISVDFALQHAITESDTEPFTDREKETIRLQMREFKRLLAQNLEATKEQQTFINERLDYLTKAVDKLNRFDWKALALSTLISISIQLTLDTEKGKLLFALFEQAMHTVIRFLGR